MKSSIADGFGKLVGKMDEIEESSKEKGQQVLQKIEVSLF